MNLQNHAIILAFYLVTTKNHRKSDENDTHEYEV